MSNLPESITAPAPSGVELPPKPVSPLVTIPVILLCLVGGGWMLHWYINAGDLSTESRLLEVMPAREGRANGVPPAIQQEDANSWAVHGREAVAVFARPGAGKPFVLRSMGYANYQFVPQDQRDRIFAARRLWRDTALAKNLKLSDVQVRQLKSLAGATIGIVHTPADASRLVGLWNDYEGAKAKEKPAAEAKLLAGLSQVAAKCVDATRNAAAARATKIKGVLTDEQWKQFEAMGK